MGSTGSLKVSNELTDCVSVWSQSVDEHQLEAHHPSTFEHAHAWRKLSLFQKIELCVCDRAPELKCRLSRMNRKIYTELGELNNDNNALHDVLQEYMM
jgi:hypothetical protein